MYHSCEFEFKKAAITKKSTEGRNIYSAIASTASIDRHKEVLIPKGCITTRFLASDDSGKSNPVMLSIHDSKQYPVGKVLDIRITKEAVQFDFEFADTENGKELEKLYTSGFMNAFSVGFIPKSYIDCYDLRDSDGNWKVSSVEFDLPDGTKESYDLSAHKTSELYGIIPKWELLEISPVPIPANPDALMLRARDVAVRKFIDQGHSKAAVSFVERQWSDNIAKLEHDLKFFMETLSADSEISKVVPYLKNSVIDEAWDLQEAKASLVAWASADKSGDKEKMDWGQFAKGFGWVDLDKADKFVSYRFCHHTVKDSELVTVWKGLTSAMADLLADSSQEDSKEIYAHLCQHYADFGKEVPEYKEYSSEELDLIRLGLSTVVEDEVETNSEDEAQTAEISDKSLVTITKGFDEVKTLVLELEETVRLRFNILGRMFDEMQKSVEASLKSESVEESTESESVENEDDSKVLAEKLSSLHALFSNIDRVNA